MKNKINLALKFVRTQYKDCIRYAKIITKKLRIKYDTYVEGSLIVNDYRFWIIYIVSTSIGCLIFYLYTFKFEYFFGIKNSIGLSITMAAICLLFPAVSLRRLHVYAILILINLVNNLLKLLSILIVCLPMLLPTSGFSQDKFMCGGGVSWQSTVMNFFDFKPIPTFSYYMPYNYERNIQGLGLQAVLTYNIADQWAFSYVPALRYDDLEINPDTIPGNYRRGLIINHQFFILRSLGMKNKFNRNHKVGIGYSLFNSFNKAIQFYDPVYQIHFSIPLRFPAITLRYDIPLGKKLLLFPTANIIYKNFPNDPVSGNRRYAFYTVSVLYTAGH